MLDRRENQSQQPQTFYYYKLDGYPLNTTLVYLPDNPAKGVLIATGEQTATLETGQEIRIQNGVIEDEGERNARFRREAEAKSAP